MLQHPGSRWWKCDLHVHTPASSDFNGSISPEQWVEAALQAKLEVVAVTDHNGVGWVDRVRAAGRDRGLIVLPGFELAVLGGTHLLGIFDAGTSTETLCATLGSCGLPPEKLGDSKSYSKTSPNDVARIIAQQGGVCIAAHADGKDGVLHTYLREGTDGKQHGGTTLQDIVRCSELLALEWKNEHPEWLAFADNSKEGYKRDGAPLPLLEGSDAHALVAIGQRYTFVKMSQPNVEGLRLALLDGALSVRRGSAIQGDPNAAPDNRITQIDVASARYFGRDNPASLSLGPWLNCVIGGHGTGKSSILEFTRLALARESELPASLDAETLKYRRAYKSRRDEGLLTEETRITVTYSHAGTDYRVSWQAAGRDVEERQLNGSWKKIDTDICARFPVRIFSQKQIYRLAQEPNAVLGIIDETPEVGGSAIRSDCDQHEKRYLAKCATGRELAARLGARTRLEDEVTDTRKAIERIEAVQSTPEVKAYERLTEQERAMSSWATSTRSSLATVEAALTEWDPPAFPQGSLAREPAANQIIAAAIAAQDVVKESRKSMIATLASARSALARTEAAIAAEKWTEYVKTTRAAYERVASSGTNDGLSSHRELLERLHELERELGMLDAAERELTLVREDAQEAAEALLLARVALTKRRQAFVKKLASDDARVQIDVDAFGDYRDAEFRLRAAINRPDTTFQEQIWSDEGKCGILYELYRGGTSSDDFLDGLQKVKSRLTAAAEGTDDQLHGKFVAHLKKLTPEMLDRIATLYPEDAVRVTYRPTASSKELRPIEQGSPGQKSAAMLAFILSYGTEPLILDQPEDDLDGHLISELIVEELRRNKSRRQMIVITHNSNIVVNGDAELILPFEVGAGQTRVVGSGGGLQERAVRDEICRVMEGGRDALERRYRRIQAAS